jgi:integrase
MPLKLIPPRKGKSPNFTIRGTHLRVYVDKSSGTAKRSVARSIRDELERKIEAGEYPPKQEAAPNRSEQPATFLTAAVAYLEAGKRRRYVSRLIKHFGETPLDQIDQAAIDGAAVAICPNTTAGARNAAVYTPVSAILRHAGVKLKMKRPKGAKGRVVTDWLTPEDARAIVQAAQSIDPELALLLCFLIYTGVRLGEALRLEWDGLYFDEQDAWMRRSKGGATGAIRLRADLCAALNVHRNAVHNQRRRVFRFHQGGHLKHQLTRAKLMALGIPCPARRPKGWRVPPHRLGFVNFHTMRHTWATWMRRYGKVDVKGLVGTGNWRDERSASRYTHVVASDEWDRVEDLPALAVGGKSVE